MKISKTLTEVDVNDIQNGTVQLPLDISRIGTGAFALCTNLTHIEIPAQIVSLGPRAFYGCSNLESITFAKDSQLQFVDSHAFEGCRKLQSIEFPDSVEKINARVAPFCDQLKEISISKATEIADYAFTLCPAKVVFREPQTQSAQRELSTDKEKDGEDGPLSASESVLTAPTVKRLSLDDRIACAGQKAVVYQVDGFNHKEPLEK